MAFQVFTFTLLILTLLSVVMVSASSSSSSPFGFLKPLQGCHKGDKLQGIRHLKNYLHRFGYLNYHHQSHHRPDDEDNNFDDELETALKTYQLNYHLNSSGILDVKTIAQMSMPRCGVADIINGGTTRMTSNNHRHHHHHKHAQHFRTVSHFSFFPGFPRWPPSKSHLTYAFLHNVPSNAMAPVARAFNTWAANTHFRFTRVSNQNADIRIGFERGDHGDGAPFDGQGGVIAHAFAPPRGIFHYDGDERYAVGRVSGAFDLETVALHEIGHLLGLGHSSVQGAIMFPTINKGETRGLHADDIQGIRALYNA